MIILSRNEIKYILGVLLSVEEDDDKSEVPHAIEMVQGVISESESIDHARLIQLETMLEHNRELLGVEKDAETEN